MAMECSLWHGSFAELAGTRGHEARGGKSADGAVDGAPVRALWQGLRWAM